MTGVLLSAGFGTRLRPLTKNRPKALLKVQERPLLDYLMEQVSAWDELSDIHLVANARMYADFYRWAPQWDAKLKERGRTLHLHCNGKLDEEDRPGAVIDLARVLERIDTANGVWVSATDSIYRFDLHPLIERYEQSGETQVLALYQPNKQRLRDQSVLQLDGTRVTGVVDQPDDPPSRWVCPSCYVLSPAAVEYLGTYQEEGREGDSLGAFIDALAGRQPVNAWRLPEGDPPATYRASDLRFHVNTRYQYEKANEVLESEPVMNDLALA